MPIAWDRESEHRLVVKISGKLSKPDVDQFQRTIEPLLRKSGKMQLLVTLADFSGWAAGKGWEDTRFAEDNDQYLDRFAIVGEEEWREKALMFSLAGLRPVAIEYFVTEAAARNWLAN